MVCRKNRTIWYVPLVQRLRKFFLKRCTSGMYEIVGNTSGSRGEKNVTWHAMVEIPSFVENIPFMCVLMWGHCTTITIITTTTPYTVLACSQQMTDYSPLMSIFQSCAHDKWRSGRTYDKTRENLPYTLKKQLWLRITYINWRKNIPNQFCFRCKMKWSTTQTCIHLCISGGITSFITQKIHKKQYTDFLLSIDTHFSKN